jgi:hypothetical protein
MDADEEWYAQLVAMATEYANMAASDSGIVEENRRMFRYVTAAS